ncbi:MAG: 2-dehydropantoate 2-reductase [Firmicutes bacterium]|nr:2-dehydropantoate 2-reductase [Bacillota bacterium]
MKILVFGLGALGTVYSCLLKEAGHQVVGLDREPVVETIRQDGVRITGIWGDHVSQLDDLVSDVQQIQSRDFDLIILTVKSFDTAAVAGQITQIMAANTYVLLAQNGYGNFEAAAQYIPQEKLVLGRVIFGAETLAPGFSKVTVIADDVVLGSPQNVIDMEVLENFAQTMSKAGIPTRASEQVMKYVWGKIIYNSALNSLGAILEVNYGKLAEVEHSRLLMDNVIREIFALLAAMKQETLWSDAEAYLRDFYEKLVPATASHHASMLQDIQRGRKTEIDALNGAVVVLGKKYGVSTPVNEVITTLVKTKEQLINQF